VLGGIFFFGAQEGEDYSLEDLTKTPNFTDYYPQDSSTSTTMKNGSSTHSSTTQFGEGGGGGPTPPASRLLYYYHPDYLGNVEYITDASGLPYQYFFYSPWGEGLVEQSLPQP